MEAEKKAFTGRLTVYDGTKLEQFSVTNDKQADDIKNRPIKESKVKLRVIKVEKKQRKRNPASPFITSTLQQEAARKLGFAVQRTMRIAQQLYEGIETEAGPMGFITYMRTDSTNLSEEAIQSIRQFIKQYYGPKELPAQPRRFRTKSKNAQEAQ